ncbi:TetR/AcrR family transcriptional regulator [Pedobacter insulae]|uniref:DNA-binding transcriptional regulator, AcrR family n=1 Tax=Pedobacter insulae TaxID=414048 RepID=A0A1I2TSZ7_9SPHI|nr:TetR/AcrR family transcriptional regulator [Pedobacter insulae]SFG65596.1 DNA-binding transcriptional regulator, AcrR family [Pedobacter insulae]
MVSAKRLKQKEEVRDAILEVARTIVLREGWQAVSIRKIADAIGYSLPVVYTHFESKDAILEEFVILGFEMLNEEIAIAKSKSTQPEQQLTLMADTYFQFAFAKREYYQMMFGLGMPSCERAKEISEIGQFGTMIIDTIQHIHPPLNNEEKIRLKFHTFWSILHGLTAINMSDMTATPNEMQQLVLQDAVQGFIKNINH